MVNKKSYVIPQLKVVEVKQSQLLCASPSWGNSIQEEVDYDDAGFN